MTEKKLMSLPLVIDCNAMKLGNPDLPESAPITVQLVAQDGTIILLPLSSTGTQKLRDTLAQIEKIHLMFGPDAPPVPVQ